ncbi:MAG: class I SAM-dependent methyltransferase [Proteobacteria bacterium]|nr:class I SAM-dependent methyltransferase [Pseudomonadota bacterium]
MTLNLKQLSSIYGEGYFHGENSGYPGIGYKEAHPVWKKYIDFIQPFKGSHIRWLDVGCAFGYLLNEAREKEISAFGVDISAYALKQASGLDPKPAQGLAERLPFSSETFDVVTAFDLIEHLYEPEAGLEEMVRVLKPEGILLFSTPDPLFFDRKEETHLSERPPSFWMNQMERLGLTARLRFYGEPFNLEILAIKSPISEKAFSFLAGFNRDYLGSKTDILKITPGSCQAVLREGWSSLEEKAENQRVRYFKKNASLYIYNGGKNPIEANLKISCGEDVSLFFHTRQEKIGIEKKDRKEEGWLIKTNGFLLPSGGHQLTIQCNNENSVTVKDVAVKVAEKEFSDYNLSLPVDQYQRYRILQQSVEAVREAGNTQRILEVGGAPGQIRGFFPQDDVTIVDLEHCDIPNFQTVDGLRLPFPDESFDLTASLDVLEHVSPENRNDFVTELVRVSKEYVFIGAPFADPALREAENILSEFIQAKLQHTHRFLDEHLSNPLPNKEETISLLEKKGFSTMVLPNGYLSHWLLMIMLHFYLNADPQLNRINRKISQYYNKHHYPFDNRSPAYRHLIIGCRNSFSRKKRDGLNKLISAEDKNPEVNFLPAALLIELLNLDLIKKKDITIEEKDKAIQNLITHSENLTKVIGGKDEIIKKTGEESKDLETRLLFSLEQNSFLAGRIGALEASIDSYQQHTQNLEQILNHPLIKVMRTCKRLLKGGDKQ